jgi:hypothetical protein
MTMIFPGAGEERVWIALFHIAANGDFLGFPKDCYLDERTSVLCFYRELGFKSLGELATCAEVKTAIFKRLNKIGLSHPPNRKESRR